MVMEVSPTAQSGRIDLNAADASTLQKELAGIGEAKARRLLRIVISMGRLLRWTSCSK
jgi:competence protein ComEA